MKKFAVIFESSPFDRKGLFNAVHNRIRHLVGKQQCSIDTYCIHSWDTSFTRSVRHTPVIVEKKDNVEIDGIRYNMLWYDFSVVDHVTVEYLHCRPFFFNRFIRKNVQLLRGYDAVIAHSFTGALFAHESFVRYGIPYYITWHGSDIHTHPYRNSLIMKDTRRVMRDAVCSFFVSHALMKKSEDILQGVYKEVLYNGVSPDFQHLDPDSRLALRKQYGINSNEKVVAFAGSLVPVKNVFALHPVFRRVASLYDGQVRFWIVGDGKLRSAVEPDMLADKDMDVKFWGNVPAGQMPSLMNCIDVLVLPSFNEGLPLVCVEALRCGADVIGSDVGGVAEAIGCDNVVPLEPDDDFVERFAVKVADRLSCPSPAVLSSDFSWEEAAERELQIILRP